MRNTFICVLVSTGLLLSACTQKPTASADAAPFRLTATIQDIMAAEVDPAADFIWDSVSTETTAKGTEEKQPHTDAEWLAVRHHALVLIEAANLLLMDGRQVALHGKALDDADVPGISKPQEIQHAIDSDRQSFVAHVHALNDAGVKALAAIDSKNAEALIAAGETLDHACETCHLKYWYPNERQAKQS